MNPTISTISGGGSATQSGTTYQNRVAAWLAVQILAEADVSAPWDLPSQATLESIRCEVNLPVDDILVANSESGHVFLQVKHSLNLESSSRSELASAFDQFVRLFLESKRGEGLSDPVKDPLSITRDRLVLAVGPESSAPVRQDLRNLLSSVRSLSPKLALDDAATNDAERNALNVVTEHVKRSWQQAGSAQPSDQDLRAVLSLIWVQELDVDAGGQGEREAQMILRSSVLLDPTQAEVAWDALITACGGYASNRTGADRQQLQDVLLRAGILINAARSYRDDIARLNEYSKSISGLLSDLSEIRVRTTTVKICRSSTSALREAVEQVGLVVVSDPGAGKSGALFDLAQVLWAEGSDVVLFAADHIEARSAGLLRVEIGLEHDLDKVLHNWPGMRPSYLIIDALDAVRSEDSQRTLRDLMFQIMARPTRWRAIASIRKYDLRYAHDLRKAFSGSPPTALRDSEFSDVRHLSIPIFEDQELEEVSRQSADLRPLISRADGGLRNLIRVPFNLRLVADLVSAGISVEDLTPIRTQVELLERYWQERVIRTDSGGDGREAVVRLAAQEMVASRSLRINRAQITTNPAASTPLNELLSAHVLAEWERPHSARPERSILTFSHHILFDYAAARLLLRGVPGTAIQRIRQDPDLSIAIRPSLVLHFQYLWWLDENRVAFWDEVFDFLHAGEIPEIAKIVGPSVAADQATQASDLAPLLTKLGGRDSTVGEVADQALRHLISGILAVG